MFSRKGFLIATGILGFGIGAAAYYLKANPSKKSTTTFNKPPDPKMQIPKDYASSLKQEMDMIKTNRIEKVDHLSEWCGIPNETIANPLYDNPMIENLKAKYFVDPGSFLPSLSKCLDEKKLIDALRFMKGGPHKYIYFKPGEVRAAIVTPGGLCPGLNVVIREIVMHLWNQYGVRNIKGIKYGYIGFYGHGDESYMDLAPEVVDKIHMQGGSILSAGRDVFNADVILDAIVAHGINQVYVIGGEGSHKGLHLLGQAVKKRGLKITTVGVPKTIDNDIKIIDQSFGLSTAIEAGVNAIDTANVEASGVHRGVGLVKLFGKDVGHIALRSSLASRDVGICLIPEFKFDVDGDKGFVSELFKKLDEKGHTVVVVAEGAGYGINDIDIKDRDPLKFDVGKFLKEKIEQHSKKTGKQAVVKYIDPSYLLRAARPNAYDRDFCCCLARAAVDGAMAGYTNFTSGTLLHRSVYIPVKFVAEGDKNRIKFNDHLWRRLVSSTHQPTFLNDLKTATDPVPAKTEKPVENAKR